MGSNRAGSVKRTLLALLGGAMILAGSGTASAGPEDTIRDLLISVDSVVATGIGPRTFHVSWRDRSLIESGFRIEVSDTENGTFTPVATAPACAGSDMICAREVVGSPPSDPTPRWFRVVPFVSGAVSIPGGPTIDTQTKIDGRPSIPDPAFLGTPQPTNLRCNGGSTCVHVNSVTLTWQDNATDEASYWLMRAKGLNPFFSGTPYKVLPPNAESFSEILDEYSTTFHYRVVSVREKVIDRLDGSVVFERSYSNSDAPAHVTVLTAPVPPPLDPTNLTVAFTPPSTVKLQWTDNAVTETGWLIEWGPEEGNWQFLHTMPASPGTGTVTWTDPTIPPDTVRCYRVRAYRLGPAYSGYSNTACIAGSVPAAPSNLTAVAPTSAEVRLAWTDNSNSETEFVVQRCNGTCTSSSTWAGIGTSAANTPTFSDGSVNPLTTYSYRVYARNSLGNSGFSNIRTVTTPKAAVAQPTNLRVVPEGITSRRIPLRWMDNATDETGYRIEYRPPAGEWDTLAEIGPFAGTGDANYVDAESLSPQQTRCYRVRALKGTEMSSASNEICGTTKPPMPPTNAPTGLTATPVTNEQIDLSWTDHETLEDHFRVEYVALRNFACSQVPVIENMPWRLLANAPARTGTGTATYQVKSLQPHSAYFFRVAAENKDGISGFSNSSGCAQTLGPRLPVFVSPEKTGDIDATRCHVEIDAPISAPEVEVGKVRLLVIATVPTGWVTDVLELDRFDSQDPYTPTIQNGKAIWTFGYHFRKGITYRLRAYSFGAAAPYYSSAVAEIMDLKVLADCPGDEVPV